MNTVDRDSQQIATAKPLIRGRSSAIRFRTGAKRSDQQVELCYTPSESAAQGNHAVLDASLDEEIDIIPSLGRSSSVAYRTSKRRAMNHAKQGQTLTIVASIIVGLLLVMTIAVLAH